MKAKWHAQMLIERFYPHVQWKLGQEDCLQRAKECAIIALDEIWYVVEGYEEALSASQTSDAEEYYKEVKKEILKYDGKRDYAKTDG